MKPRGRAIAFALMAVAIVVAVWAGLTLAGKRREPPSRPASQAAGARRATLGIHLKAKNGELQVSRVQPGGAAERGGVRAGDLLRAVGGVSVNTLDEMQGAVRQAEPGVELRLSVLRGGRELSLSMVPE
jgi:S1-C subfamily serine protease